VTTPRHGVATGSCSTTGDPDVDAPSLCLVPAIGATKKHAIDRRLEQVVMATNATCGFANERACRPDRATDADIEMLDIGQTLWQDLGKHDNPLAVISRRKQSWFQWS
jgi:hypothetical protein